MQLQTVLLHLRRQVSQAERMQDWADQNGFARSYISDVLNGNRAPGRPLLDHLGFEKVISYRRKRGA
jgi:hypothetical protein